MSHRLLERARPPICEKAIKQVKAKIASQRRRVEDYAEDPFEDLVADEEATVRNRLKPLPCVRQPQCAHRPQRPLEPPVFGHIHHRGLLR